MAQKGFTLVEVLIASVILFFSITVGAMVMSTALDHLQRVSYYSRMGSAVYMVKNLVREEIEQKRFRGRGDWGREWAYEWEAKEIRSAPSVSNYGDSDGMAATGRFRLTLYQIKVKMMGKPPVASKTRSFEYKELLYDKLS